MGLWGFGKERFIGCLYPGLRGVWDVLPRRTLASFTRSLHRPSSFWMIDRTRPLNQCFRHTPCCPLFSGDLRKEFPVSPLAVKVFWAASTSRLAWLYFLSLSTKRITVDLFRHFNSWWVAEPSNGNLCDDIFITSLYVGSNFIYYIASHLYFASLLHVFTSRISSRDGQCLIRLALPLISGTVHSESNWRSGHTREQPRWF